MKSFLRKVVEEKKKEIYDLSQFPIVEKADHAFERSLKSKRPAIIAEIKAASPSKGNLRKLNLAQIAKKYDKADIQAISVLTEKEFFKGDPSYIKKIKKYTKKPILRKDFIIDENQIYESRELGADAILLIGELLTLKQLNIFIAIADSLGMDCLVEAHESSALKKILKSNAKIIGVNNRNLKTLKMNLRTVSEYASKIPEEKIFVAESGIDSSIDMHLLPSNVRAVLIGSSIMQAKNIEKHLKELRSTQKKVKICGNTNSEDAKKALSLGADLLGFIINVKKSKDTISLSKAKTITKQVPRDKVCAVTLTTDLKELKNICKELNPRFLQLHDKISVSGVKKLRKEFPHISLIKTIIVEDLTALKQAQKYEPYADLILLDSKNPGSGKTHDWSVSAIIVANLKKPVMLAGGLNPKNVSKAIKTVRPFGVDVNSGVKAKDRKKSPTKLKQFISRAK